MEMSKQEVEDRNLVDCVLREDDEVLTFAAWWKTVEKDAVVEVQYPHDHHGLAGKPSNHATERRIMSITAGHLLWQPLTELRGRRDGPHVATLLQGNGFTSTGRK